MGLYYILARLAAKVLDFDDTVVPRQQLIVLNDVLAKRHPPIVGKEAREILQCIKKKHLVNSVTVGKSENGVVFSSEGDGHAEVRSAVALVKHINSNIGKADVVALRGEREWLSLLSLDSSLYIVRANSSLSTIELRALAKEVEGALKKQLRA
ncbi:MAG: hypothetical protein NTW59_04225 [Candidatus Diapherotrites archaeon]|nr:hypothetical protein [Candidatus Diapherotrites archaeon]